MRARSSSIATAPLRTPPTKDNRSHRNDLFEKETHYQEFMAQHGPEARAKRAADV
jgi:hypothetical protein